MDSLSPSLEATLTRMSAQLTAMAPASVSNEDGQYVLLEFDGLPPEELRGELALQACVCLT